MKVEKGTVVTIREMESIGEGKKERQGELHFGLVLGATPPENNPNHCTDLFDVRMANGVEPIMKHEMFPVAQIQKDSIASMSLEDVVRFATQDILLFLLAKRN